MSRRVFDNILDNILYPKLGHGLTSTRQLRKTGQEQLGGIFKGVFAINTMKPLNDQECEIVNTDEAGGRGEHWIAFIRDGDIVYAFDSYGRSHRNILDEDELKRRLGVNYIHDSTRACLQSVLQQDCGQKCLAFLIMSKYWGH